MVKRCKGIEPEPEDYGRANHVGPQAQAFVYAGHCRQGNSDTTDRLKGGTWRPDGSIRLETVVKMTGRLMTLAHVFFKGEKQQEVLGTLGAVLASVAMATAVLTPAELARAARRKRLRN